MAGNFSYTSQIVPMFTPKCRLKIIIYKVLDDHLGFLEQHGVVYSSIKVMENHLGLLEHNYMYTFSKKIIFFLRSARKTIISSTRPQICMMKQS